MASTDRSSPDALQELRRFGRELRDVPGRMKGNIPETRRQELATVVARAVSGGVSIEDLERELPPYPPQVIGRAMASIWGDLPSDRRSKIIGRLKTLESERTLGEALPMVVHLLKTPATATFAPEIVAVLPTSEKTAHRVATEILGEDSVPLAALGVPNDELTAAAMLRVLMKAAFQEKAQAFRRFQLLRLVLPWLDARDRYRDAKLLDLVSQVRQLPKKITGPAMAEWSQSLAREAGWQRVLGGDAAPATSPTATPLPNQAAPPVSEQVSVISTSLSREPVPAPSEELSLEDARSMLRSLYDRRVREARALNRVLGAIRASEYAKGQTERDVQEARDRERKALTEQDSLRQQVEQLQSHSHVLQEKHKSVTEELTRKDIECKTLAEQLAKERESVQTTREEFKQATQDWKEQQAQLETQVVENAKVRVAELGNRLASRLAKLLADVPNRSEKMKGDGTAAVLHTRIHELLDVLKAEGIPIRSE
jgi:flagellar biosynthesis GTPase FlhF